MDSRPRVVVTGMGAVSPLGLSCAETFAGLIAGKSGIDRITCFDPGRLASQIAGEVKDFDPANYMDRKMARRIGRYSQFAIAAVGEAVAHAELDLDAVDPARVASVTASAIGDFPMLEQQLGIFLTKGPGHTNPFTVPRVSSSMAAGNVSLQYNLTGPSFGLSSACATGSHSIASAWMMLKLGMADVVIAGGAEAAISEAFLESYIALRALSTRNSEPQRASRPFDKHRDGFVMAEGCGILVLETLGHARARQAPILAELAGVGMSCDAYHITAAHPDGRGARQAICAALDSAGLSARDVDYINAHGTATPVNDPIETSAIKSAFGEYAYTVPVSSIKSMIGHSIGASGALEAVCSVMALNENMIPPTINLDEPDPLCDLDYVPHRCRQAQLEVVLSSSFAFGGQNCVLVFERPRTGRKTRRTGAHGAAERESANSKES